VKDTRNIKMALDEAIWRVMIMKISITLISRTLLFLLKP
jgi:hypothetical protein